MTPSCRWRRRCIHDGICSRTEIVTTTANVHEPFIRAAIDLAAEARRQGNHPFGALLVLDGEVVLNATNTVKTDQDPTAHVETNLVASAIRQLSPDQIRRTVLNTSCEPCAMCVGKMYWAGIRSVVYGLSSDELAGFVGRDFLIPCRELFQWAVEPVTVIGPLLEDDAWTVHVGYWR